MQIEYFIDAFHLIVDFVSHFQASGSLSIATGSKQPQAAAIGAAGGGGARVGGGGNGGAAAAGGNGGGNNTSDADADLQARLDNLRRE